MENSQDFIEISKYIDKKNITYLKVNDSCNGLIDHNDIPENCELDKPISEEIKKNLVHVLNYIEHYIYYQTLMFDHVYVEIWREK